MEGHVEEHTPSGRLRQSPAIRSVSGKNEAKGARAEAESVARLELRRPLELDAVEECAVGGAEVPEVERAVTTLDLRRVLRQGVR